MYLTFIHIKAPIHALSYLPKFFSYSMQIEWNLEKKNVKARQKLYTYTWVDLNILIYPDILIVWEIFSHRTKSVRKLPNYFIEDCGIRKTIRPLISWRFSNSHLTFSLNFMLTHLIFDSNCCEIKWQSPSY